MWERVKAASCYQATQIQSFRQITALVRIKNDKHGLENDSMSRFKSYRRTSTAGILYIRGINENSFQIQEQKQAKTSLPIISYTTHFSLILRKRPASWIKAAYFCFVVQRLQVHIPVLCCSQMSDLWGREQCSSHFFFLLSKIFSIGRDIFGHLSKTFLYQTCTGRLGTKNWNF